MLFCAMHGNRSIHTGLSTFSSTPDRSGEEGGEEGKGMGSHGDDMQGGALFNTLGFRV